MSNPDDPLEPGDETHYESTCRIADDDLAYAGLIINAIAVKAFTAAGACFYDEQDATITVPGNR